ncbi:MULTISPECIES: hemolysin family protein [unclassified Pseudodesulfovibrio]|uniref:hemolysin family protein n=1 Tax=unclassified Pseudodesulfovibrio TaxID=2661612 RepID=UPI000FEBF27E|nr:MULTISPECIES: hemolysin family protein [unclassified Pseudodesulfovibrio]MCJ2163902.1 hemolysin family protein [Pseudodesulfovibrio sp. S3-i]RWU05853.1 HlyC/CorC family transporter [Pseudodesulfovibrio sp. S3]
MDEGSDSRFLTIFKKIFGSNSHHIEEHILEAKADGELDSHEVSMLLNVLELDEKLVEEIMVPRTDMVCADSASTVKDVAEIIVQQGAHSRIPIYQDSKDYILGVVHAKDLLAPLLEGRMDALVHDLMRPAYFVYEETPLNEVLSSFKREKLHMGIVQDEYGGTSGMVTMEDVLEEIVGEIADEYDQQRPDEIQESSDGTFIVSGRTSLEEVSQKYALGLESEDVDSIGGFLAAMSGRIPAQGELFTFNGWRFTILEADDRQIWTIKVEPSGLG